MIIFAQKWTFHRCFGIVISRGFRICKLEYIFLTGFGTIGDWSCKHEPKNLAFMKVLTLRSRFWPSGLLKSILKLCWSKSSGFEDSKTAPVYQNMIKIMALTAKWFFFKLRKSLKPQNWTQSFWIKILNWLPKPWILTNFGNQGQFWKPQNLRITLK